MENTQRALEVIVENAVERLLEEVDEKARGRFTDKDIQGALADVELQDSWQDWVDDGEDQRPPAHPTQEG